MILLPQPRLMHHPDSSLPSFFMTKLPQIKPRKIENVLIKLGFTPRSGRSSHVVFKHPDGRRTVIPVHNRPVRTGTLRSILKQVDLSTGEFLKLLKK